ncbi:MAG: hypothetical protein MK073_06500 [Phycisphaerales bacterium]|nr:hypothetical protein [Phycisphaerales bacterium]
MTSKLTRERFGSMPFADIYYGKENGKHFYEVMTRVLLRSPRLRTESCSIEKPSSDGRFK